MKTSKTEYFPIIQPSPVMYFLRLFAIFILCTIVYRTFQEESIKVKLVGGLVLLLIPLLFRWTVIQASSEGIRISRTLLLKKRYFAWSDIDSVSLLSSYDAPVTMTIWVKDGTEIKQALNVPQLLLKDLFDVLKQYEVTIETNLSFD
ncbi:hypothetical protein BKI52_21650 [marine bacterium AO1-C]|nr:hypothetical protein BKI52_21650 [marine bacterium AO1-C]